MKHHSPVMPKGPAARASGKKPFPTSGTVARNAKSSHPGTGAQMNPRRDRTQDYEPSCQPRPGSVKY